MKYYVACIQKLSELVSQQINTKNQEFMMCPSLRVFETNDFEFLTEPKPSVERALRHEDISIQLNSMSSKEASWDIDVNNNLFDRYKEYIKTLKIKDQSTISDEIGSGLGLLYDEAGLPTEQLVKYSEMLHGYEGLLEEKQTLQEQLSDVETEEAKQIIQDQLKLLKRKITLQLVDWKSNGFKSSIEAALDKENKLSDYDTFLELKSKVESELLNAELTGMQSMSSFTRLQMIPSNFYKDATTWSQLEIEDKEVDAIFEKAKILVLALMQIFLTLTMMKASLRK